MTSVVCRHCGVNHEIQVKESRCDDNSGAWVTQFVRTFCPAAAIEIGLRGDYSRRAIYEGEPPLP